MIPKKQTTSYGKLFVICAASFAILLVWLLIWPQTGEGDSALHYNNLRDSAMNPINGLHPWARPLYVLVMVFPAMGGIFSARIFSALITTVLIWQTIRMAEDLKFRNSILAGVFLVVQPFVFAMASDTMTELPMALLMVIAIRLWWRNRLLTSCVLMSFSPLLRPEGFFLIVLWGCMILFSRKIKNLYGRLTLLPSLAMGMFCWVIACLVLTGNPLWFLDTWSWPAGSYESYGSGSFFHHFVLWPDYCGPILFALFIAGLVACFEKTKQNCDDQKEASTPSMALPWGVWGIVFGVHTILWWRGWFASCGLMRIQATSAPVTALVCLTGWNAIADFLRRKKISQIFVKTAALFTIGLALICAMARYVADVEHQRCFPMQKAVGFVKSKDLIGKAPLYIFGDQMVFSELGLTTLSPRAITNFWDKEKQLKLIDVLPCGTIALWDNQRGPLWYNVTIDDFKNAGFEVIFEARQKLIWEWAYLVNYKKVQDPKADLRYVVMVRKDPKPATGQVCSKDQ